MQILYGKGIWLGPRRRSSQASPTEIVTDIARAASFRAAIDTAAHSAMGDVAVVAQATILTHASNAAETSTLPEATTVAHGIDMAHAIGARVIFFRTGQEGTYFQEPARQAARQIADAGLIPCGCPVIACRDPDAEAEVAIQTMLDGYAG